MQRNTATVARFEYTKTVRRASFWLTSLLLPAFILLIGWIGNYTSSETAQNTASSAVAEHSFLLVDEVDFFATNTPENVSRIDSVSTALEQVRTGEADALVHLPTDLASSSTYVLVAQDRGLTGNAAYSSFAKDLIQSRARARIDDPLVRATLSDSLRSSTTIYTEDGTVKEELALATFVVPALGFVVFFLAVFVSSQYLLQSVTEEKENRMIESLLAVVDKGELIRGKIIGLSLVAITQLLIWVVFGAAVAATLLYLLNVPHEVLPVIGQVFGTIALTDIVVAFICILLGFFFFASVIVGVGSIGTTQRESQQLSAVFIVAAVFPVYFSSLILNDPSGPIGTFFTYFPFTSALISMLRYALDAIALPELLLLFGLNIIYVLIAFRVARALFELGMLMYHRKPTMSEVVRMFTAVRKER